MRHEEQRSTHPVSPETSGALLAIDTVAHSSGVRSSRCAACGGDHIPNHRFCYACGAEHPDRSGAYADHRSIPPVRPQRRGLGAPPRHRSTSISSDDSPARLSSSTPDVARRRKRIAHKRRRQSWSRRHPILSLAVVLLLAGIGVLTLIADRAASTIETVQSVSTPPASVALVPESDPSTGTEPAPVIINTDPARAAVASSDPGNVQSDDGGLLGAISNSAAGVGDAVLGAADAAGVTETDLEPLTILLMGVDARPGEAIDVGVRPDALAVMRLDPEAGTCRLLNIPRDSRVALPGYGLTKINHALAVGGIAYQQLVVENFLGIPIERYALTDFGGIVTLVDSLGGITITVTEPFTFGGFSFEAGERMLTGDEALVYARYRYGPDGDFGRIRRQQQVLRALLDSAVNQEPITLIRDVLPQLQEHVRTNLSPRELVALGTEFRGVCTEETLVTLSLDGTVATFDDPLFHMPLSFVVVSEDEVRRKVAELLLEA